MRLLQVNGVSILGAIHQETVSILRSAGNTITLIVCTVYDRNKAEQALTLSSGRESKESRISREPLSFDDAKSISECF